MKLLNFSEKATKLLQPSLRDAILEVIHAQLGPCGVLHARIQSTVREQAKLARHNIESLIFDEVKRSVPGLARQKQNLLDEVRTYAENVARAEARNARSDSPSWAVSKAEFDNRINGEIKELKGTFEHYLAQITYRIDEASSERASAIERLEGLETNAANGFDMHVSKLREIIDERILHRVGTQQQFRDAVKSLVEDKLESQLQAIRNDISEQYRDASIVALSKQLKKAVDDRVDGRVREEVKKEMLLRTYGGGKACCKVFKRRDGTERVCVLEPGHEGRCMEDGEGSGPIGVSSFTPVFTPQEADSEVCAICGKLVRYHYGGTEMRCFSRGEEPPDTEGAWEMPEIEEQEKGETDKEFLLRLANRPSWKRHRERLLGIIERLDNSYVTSRRGVIQRSMFDGKARRWYIEESRDEGKSWVVVGAVGGAK